MKSYYRVFAEVDLDAICENIQNTRRRIWPGTQIMGIIKADGYGHGAIPVAKAVADGFDAYGVAILEEGAELRRAGFQKPILLLGYTQKPLYPDMIHYDLMPAVFTAEMAKEISKEALRQKKTARIHIKLDTGMGRIGFPVGKETIQQIVEISKLPGIELAGCFSHFSKADERDKAYAKRQLKQFLVMCGQLEKAGVSLPQKHISNSAGILDLPQANLSMVRSGISTYGLYPSKEVDQAALPLKPALSLKSYVSHVKVLEEGCLVGYGGTYRTARPTAVATIPVGYADGYSRELSNQGFVLLHGQRAPVIGRICMDQFMADVTELMEPVREGDLVTLLGSDGSERITAEEIGAMTHSFNYEVVCGIGKRVPRVYRYRGRTAGTCDYYSTAPYAFDLDF